MVIKGIVKYIDGAYRRFVPENPAKDLSWKNSTVGFQPFTQTTTFHAVPKGHIFFDRLISGFLANKYNSRLGFKKDAEYRLTAKNFTKFEFDNSNSEIILLNEPIERALQEGGWLSKKTIKRIEKELKFRQVQYDLAETALATKNAQARVFIGGLGAIAEEVITGRTNQSQGYRTVFVEAAFPAVTSGFGEGLPLDRESNREWLDNDLIKSNHIPRFGESMNNIYTDEIRKRFGIYTKDIRRVLDFYELDATELGLHGVVAVRGFKPTVLGTDTSKRLAVAEIEALNGLEAIITEIGKRSRQQEEFDEDQIDDITEN